MVVTKYYCSVCGEEYKTKTEAEMCEFKTPQRSFEFRIGEPYTLSQSPFDFGMFIGECIIGHIRCPIVFKYNDKENSEPERWAMDTSTDGYYNIINDKIDRKKIETRGKEMLNTILFDMKLINEREF